MDIHVSVCVFHFSVPRAVRGTFLLTGYLFSLYNKSSGPAGCGGSVMELQTLSRISDELDSLEVAALCFLCRDVVSRKGLEGVSTACNMPEEPRYVPPQPLLLVSACFKVVFIPVVTDY